MSFSSESLDYSAAKSYFDFDLLDYMDCFVLFVNLDMMLNVCLCFEDDDNMPLFGPFFKISMKETLDPTVNNLFEPRIESLRTRPGGVVSLSLCLRASPGGVVSFKFIIDFELCNEPKN
jgi:hypothetical protein